MRSQIGFSRTVEYYVDGADACQTNIRVAFCILVFVAHFGVHIRMIYGCNQRSALINLFQMPPLVRIVCSHNSYCISALAIAFDINKWRRNKTKKKNNLNESALNARRLFTGVRIIQKPLHNQIGARIKFLTGDQIFYAFYVSSSWWFTLLKRIQSKNVEYVLKVARKWQPKVMQ